MSPSVMANRLGAGTGGAGGEAFVAALFDITLEWRCATWPSAGADFSLSPVQHR